MRDLKKHIRNVPDFPKPGILFYDIGTLLADGAAWADTVQHMSDILRPQEPDKVIGIESRGFLIGAAVAASLGVGFIMLRKKGKLPGAVIPHTYALEYGHDTIELQEGVLAKGERVVICDDLLATGGTAAAAINLVRQVGAEVLSAAFVVELTFLKGRQKLDVPVTSLASYDE